jgi:outer membrane protein TolC
MVFFLFSNLSLQNYLQQVEKSDYINILSQKTYKNISLKKNLIHSPRLTSETSFMKTSVPEDFKKKIPENTIIMEDIGLDYSSPFGVNFDIKYSPKKTFLSTTDSSNTSYANTLSINAKTSLSKNFLGSQIKLSKQVIEDKEKLNEYSWKIKKNQFLLEAEKVFLLIYLSYKKITLLEEGYLRSSKIYQQSLEKRKNNLIDQSDLLQAEAGKYLYEMQLDLEKNKLDKQWQDFFYYLGKKSETNLPLLEIDLLQYLEIIPEFKQDLLKLQKTHQLSLNKNLLLLEKKDLLPDISLYGGIFFQSNDQALLKDALILNKNTFGYQGGLKLSIPFFQRDIYLLQQELFKESFLLEKEILQESMKADINYSSLKNNFLFFKENLKKLTEITKLQKNRLHLERKKLSYGSSTLFQVYLLEKDYLDAQMKELETLSNIITIKIQLKAFSL